VTIEVRQMLIRSVVGDESQYPARRPAPGGPSAPEIERLRAQLLAECKAWLAEQLREREER
jgi:hypothetical protein